MSEEETRAESSVYARIRSMILNGTIAPGEKITIDRMARELGVSQTPVREAMQRLEGDKLVRTRKPRGYATTPLLSHADLQNMIEVRLLLEPWAARSAAVDRASNPGRAMLAEVDDYAGVAGKGDWRQALTGHDTAFHTKILEAVNNSFLLDAYRQMHPHLHLFRLYPVDMHGDDTMEEHRRIATAIAECRPEEAESAMRDHLMASLDRFSKSIPDHDDSQEPGIRVEESAERGLDSVRSRVLGLPEAGNS